VSSDGRYQKTFVVGRNRVIAFIELARTRAKKVIVIVCPGNHDTLSAWHLGDSLECYFHKYKDVEIRNEPTPRKYHQFGQVMLMFTHGDKGKKDKYPLLMATEEPEMFGKTKFREVHTGHLHKTQLDEHNGIRVRVLPALCAADDWHAQMGFVGNLRSAEAYIWSREEGLVGTAIFTA
jgi:DNA repair exonuclease SbcCD nuclease subunit